MRIMSYAFRMNEWVRDQHANELMNEIRKDNNARETMSKTYSHIYYNINAFHWHSTAVVCLLLLFVFVFRCILGSTDNFYSILHFISSFIHDEMNTSVPLGTCNEKWELRMSRSSLLLNSCVCVCFSLFVSFIRFLLLCHHAKNCKLNSIFFSVHRIILNGFLYLSDSSASVTQY